MTEEEIRQNAQFIMRHVPGLAPDAIGQFDRKTGKFMTSIAYPSGLDIVADWLRQGDVLVWKKPDGREILLPALK